VGRGRGKRRKSLNIPFSLTISNSAWPNKKVGSEEKDEEKKRKRGRKVLGADYFLTLSYIFHCIIGSGAGRRGEEKRRRKKEKRRKREREKENPIPHPSNLSLTPEQHELPEGRKRK